MSKTKTYLVRYTDVELYTSTFGVYASKDEAINDIIDAAQTVLRGGGLAVIMATRTGDNGVWAIDIIGRDGAILESWEIYPQ